MGILAATAPPLLLVRDACGADDAQRLALLDAVRVSPADALRLAAKEAPAGLPFRIALVRRGDDVVHDIRLVTGDGEVRVDVDAVKGVILLRRDSVITDERRRELASMAPLLRTATLSPLEAAQRVLSRPPGGRLLAVEAEVERGALQYEVTLMTSDGPTKVEVDANTGEVGAVASRRPRQNDDPRRSSFDHIPAGRPPEHWTAEAPGVDAPPAWVVRPDPSAPSAPHVLGVQSPASDASAALVTWNRRLRLQDGTVEATLRVQPAGGAPASVGGLVWRLRDALEHYAVTLDGPARQLRLEVVKDGQRRRIAAVPFVPAAGAWSTLAVQHDGDRITVLLNGEPRLEANDSTLPAEGFVGVWMRGDGVVAVDEVRGAPNQEAPRR
jgi:uncharacterized membrane protein YkoI